MIDLMLGDCLERLKDLPDCSVDACVTDPPYGLSFRGKGWDHAVPSADVWREVLRVLKPGSHLLAFAGTRTQHRMACAIEDAGFEVRDMIAWVYGSGFPKAHNLGGDWQGWGTALKPALEPITVARKPFTGTVAANVLAWGTGAVNVDGCRVGGESTRRDTGTVAIWGSSGRIEGGSHAGRWPANLIHDGSAEVVGLFPGDDVGSAARFFYCAKADQADRDDGLEGFRVASGGERSDRVEGSAGQTAYAGTRTPARNIHPTVKPTDLMRYLCRLVTPPGGVILDPFMGSGSTGRGAVLEGFGFVGIELDPEYLAIARARIEAAHVMPVKAEGIERPVSTGQLGLFG